MKADGEIPQGNWDANRSFTIMSAIYEWKMRPSDFNLCTEEEDLILMAAFLAVKADMAAYERKLADDRIATE